jgi:hypothetical protein
MNINEIVPVTIGLSASPASQARFSTPILMVDHADIPVDKRYRTVTRSSYATALTASTDHLSWCTTLWSQNYNPSIAYIGRWVSSATPAYMVFPDAVATAATYAALTSTGQIKIVEGVSNEDINPDFTGDTSMTDVCASIETALGLGTLTASYTCSLDAYDRVVIYSDNTGSAADAVSAATPAAGTDLTGSAYLGAEFSVAGLDAETLGESLAAIFAKDNTPFIVCERGAVLAEKVAFSTSVNAMDKILLLVTNDTDCKDSSSTTDMAYLIEALGHQKTHITYTEHSTQNPDAAICGEIFPRKEATTNLALTPLTGLSESGLDVDGTTVIPLTSDEISALEDKGTDFLVNPAGYVHLTNGLAAGGNEIRIMVGKAFMAAKISEDIYAYLLANDVVTFSDEDINAIKSRIVYWAEEMVDRKVLEAGYEITMPAASDFTAAMKATHQMDLDDLADMPAQIAVNKVDITLTWNV